MDWQQGNTTKVPALDPLWMLNHFHYIDMCSQNRLKTYISLLYYADAVSYTHLHIMAANFQKTVFQRNLQVLTAVHSMSCLLYTSGEGFTEDEKTITGTVKDLIEFPTKQPTNAGSVSYTHLDVYKRQGQL